MKNPFKDFDVVRCSACGTEIHLHVDRYRRVHAGHSVWYYCLPNCPPKPDKPLGIPYG